MSTGGATTVSEQVDPAYPGGPSAVSPVEPAELTTTFTNDGEVPATSVRTSMAMPDGRTATAVSSPTNNNVGNSRSFTTTWSVTAPRGVDPASYPFSATTSYLWDDGTRNGRASGSTKVLVVAPLPIGSSQLGDDAWTSAGSGWGPVERNQSNGEQAAADGKPLTIQGATFAKGLRTHADSEVVYHMGQAFSTATTKVSVDDEAGDSHGNVGVFQMWADDHKVADSLPVSASDAARTLTADVSGARFLRIVVNKGNDGVSFDHADRADALITCC